MKSWGLSLENLKKNTMCFVYISHLCPFFKKKKVDDNSSVVLGSI